MQEIAVRHGWLPAARYTNLRDAKTFDRLGFLDIEWKRYNFKRHLEAARAATPLLTVARDVERVSDLPQILEEAAELSQHAEIVLIVPKDPALAEGLEERIPKTFMFGFSTPTKYGGTTIPTSEFKRPVHLLGGSPRRQLELSKELDVFSFDCNRFTIDASYGDAFDGERFRPHPIGGYEVCLEASILAINAAWARVCGSAKCSPQSRVAAAR